MSHYKPYPEYKESGITWLGAIPEHWGITRLKFVSELNPKKSSITESSDSLCTFLPMEKLKTDSVILDETRVIDEVYDGYSYFSDDDILIAKVTPCFENKNIAIASNLVNGIGFGSTEINTIRANEKSFNRFLYYRLQEEQFRTIAINEMTGTGGLKRVPSEFFQSFKVALPDFDEQKHLALQINKEVNRIDTLITKKTRFIELLKEKRQALITHAVTKGLDPDVPMKDSGIVWLYEMPENWKGGNLRWYAKLYAGGRPSKNIEDYWINGTIPWINSGAVNDSTITSPSTYITEDAFNNSSAKWIPKGALVMALAGQGKTKATVAQLGIDTTCNQSMAAIVPNSKCNPRYLYWWLHSNYQNIRNMAGGDLRDGLNLELLGNIQCPIPPLNEQQKIVDFIDTRGC